jgi:hypothetical protein
MKRKLREGDIMRIKATGTLVRLVFPPNPNEEQVLIDSKGYVYVEPVELVDDWYAIQELEPVAGPEPSRAKGSK